MSRRTVLEAFGRVLRLETHNLVLWPGLLWQQCYNELQWDAVARVAVSGELTRRTEPPGALPWLHRRTRLRQARGLRQVLEGHEGEVLACAIDPAASFVVSGGDDHTLRIWDLETGRELRRLVGHERAVLACAFAPDGAYLVSGGADATLRIWDTRTGVELRRLEGHRSAVRACAVAPDGSFLVSGGGPPALGDGAFMVSGSGAMSLGEPDFSVRIWDPASGRELHRLDRHSGPVLACAVAPDGSFVVSAGGGDLSPHDDHKIRIWDTASGRLLHTLKGHKSRVRACAVSPDGRLVVSASGDGTLRTWDTRKGRKQRKGEWPHRTEHRFGTTQVRFPSACGVSPDGSFVVAGGSDGSLRAWDPVAVRELRTLPGHVGEVTDCHVAPDGELAVSAGRDASLRVWGLVTAPERGTDEGHMGPVAACAAAPDGSFVVSAGVDTTVKIRNPETGAELRTLSGHQDDVDACAVAPDGSFVVSGGKDGTLRMWDPVAGREIRRLTGRGSYLDHPVSGCAVSPDGSMIACTMSHIPQGFAHTPEQLVHALKVWSAGSGQLLQSLDGWGVVRGCAFTPDGARVVVGAADGSLMTWEPGTGRQLRIRAHGGSVLACAVSPDGAYVVSAGADEPLNALKLWELGSEADETRLLGRHAGAQTCAVSSDGSLIVSGGWDQTLRVWDVESGLNFATIPLLGGVRCVALHPALPLVFCGDSTGAVNVVELTGTRYGPLLRRGAATPA